MVQESDLLTELNNIFPELTFFEDELDILLNPEYQNIFTVIEQQYSSIEKKILEKLDRDHNGRYFHSRVHTQQVVKNAEALATKVSDILSNHITTEKKAFLTKRLMVLAKLAALFHDVVQGRSDGQNEAKSCLELEKYLDSIFFNSSNEHLNKLKLVMLASIQATRVDGSALAQQKIKQGLISDNHAQDLGQLFLLSNILCAADLLHFAYADFSRTLEMSVRLWLEIGQISNEGDITLNKLVILLGDQVKFFSKYNFPEGLPRNIRNELEQKKKSNIKKIEKEIAALKSNSNEERLGRWRQLVRNIIDNPTIEHDF